MTDQAKSGDANLYDVGDVVVMTDIITDPETGNRVDPATVTFTIRKGKLGTVVCSATRVSQGVYTASYTLVHGDPDGCVWTWAVDSTGTWQGSGERAIEIRRQQVPRS